MEKPRGIDYGEALRWNADVERRRIAHHQKRCAEDPIYKRAYERQQEILQRLKKIHGVFMAQLMNNCTPIRKEWEHPPIGDKEQTMKSHEQVMRDRALLLEQGNKKTPFSDLLSLAIRKILFDAPEGEQWLKDLEEEVPYAEEIRKTDHEFDSELIRMSGFEW